VDAEGVAMKARRWLLVAAALTLLPSAALAQKKKPGKTPAATAPAPAPAAPAAAGAGGEIELDAPATPPADQAGATGAAGATATGSAEAGAGGGICEIDPSACPKQEDIKKAASKNVNAEIYAVEQIYALRYHRFEIQPYWSFTLNDQFVSHNGPGLGLNYYITNVLAVGLNGNLYAGLNGDSAFNFETRRAARVAVPLNEYQWGANLNFTYVPVYGKFAGFNEFIFSYDAYIVGGVGALSTRPIAVIDPDNRNFKYKPKVDFNVGIGLRIFLNRWFAANLEVRDYIYNEQLENLSIAQGPIRSGTGPDESSKWFGENRLTNNVQAQLGVSIFLPFGWEYRLPK
jgi:outer membrane beta-barrel protein